MPEMTYRQWLIGVIAGSYHPSPYTKENVQLIIEFADALIAEMEKPNKANNLADIVKEKTELMNNYPNGLIKYE